MTKSPTPNNYQARLIEKLQQQAALHDEGSAFHEELARLLQPVEGVTPQKRAKRDTETQDSNGVTNHG